MARSAPIKSKEDLEALIAERFSELSPKLQLAAKAVLAGPKSIAIQSMRQIAAAAHLQPSSLLRLARELGFDSYEDLRALYVDWLSSSEISFVARAKSLRDRRAANGANEWLAQMSATEAASVANALGPVNIQGFETARRVLLQARHHFILGLRSLYPAAFFLDYSCRLFSDKSVLVSGVGGTVADELRRATDKDALIAFSIEPYAQATADAVEFARERDVKVIAITDSTVSPIAEGASAVLLVPNAGDSVLPSIMPIMALAQALAGFLVAAGGDAMIDRVAKSEAQLIRLRAYKSR